MYEQNTATAAPAADSGGFFGKRGARPTVGYAAPAPLPPVQHAPLSPMEAVPAAPAAVTSAPGPINFTAAPQGFGTEAPLHPGFTEAPNHPGFQEVSPTFAAAHQEAPHAEAPIHPEAPTHPEAHAQTFAAAPQPDPILSSIPTFDQAPFPAEPSVTVPEAAAATPASTYVPQSFSAAFGNGAPETPLTTGGAEYAHAPAYEGPLEPLPVAEPAPQVTAAFAPQPEDLSGPEKLAAIPADIRPHLGIDPNASFDSLPQEQKDLIESTPAIATPEAPQLEVPENHPAVQTVLEVLNGDTLASVDGSVRLHAAAFKVMLEKAGTPDGQEALYTQGFKELEKVAHGLPAGSADLNKLLEGATELLRDDIITATNQLEIARVSALSGIADGTIGSANAAIIQAQRNVPQHATPPQQGEPQPGKFTATVTQEREQSATKEHTPGYI